MLLELWSAALGVFWGYVLARAVDKWRSKVAEKRLEEKRKAEELLRLSVEIGAIKDALCHQAGVDSQYLEESLIRRLLSLVGAGALPASVLPLSQPAPDRVGGAG